MRESAASECRENERNDEKWKRSKKWLKEEMLKNPARILIGSQASSKDPVESRKILKNPEKSL